MLHTEEEYHDILNTFKMCILSRGCTRCSEKVNLSTNNILRCTNKICKNKYNVYKNTIFANSKISELTILKLINLFLNSVPVSLISHISAISRQTISKLVSKLNKATIFNAYLNTLAIGGDNDIVEIDESKLGKRKYNRGHRVEGVWVFGAVSRSTRNIILMPVHKRTTIYLENIMFRFVKQKSIIYSDCWKSYSRLGNFFKAHRTVNHSKEFKNSETGVHTNTIEGNWYALKRTVPLRCRNWNFIYLYLLRFMLFRNNKMTKLKDILIISLCYKYD